MNTEYLGGAHDIVKRFFCETMRSLDYTIYIDPMWLNPNDERDGELFALLGVKHIRHQSARPGRTCLLIDPAIGVAERPNRTHVSLDRIADELVRHSIVFALDQSFSRSTDRQVQMSRKLTTLARRGVAAFYYDSSAKFLFASRTASHLESVKLRLRAMGVPEQRIFEGLRESRRVVPADAQASPLVA